MVELVKFHVDKLFMENLMVLVKYVYWYQEISFITLGIIFDLSYVSMISLHSSHAWNCCFDEDYLHVSFTCFFNVW